jgi:HSP20 family molecular chaperone IbpA
MCTAGRLKATLKNGTLEVPLSQDQKTAKAREIKIKLD